MRKVMLIATFLVHTLTRACLITKSNPTKKISWTSLMAISPKVHTKDLLGANKLIAAAITTTIPNQQPLAQPPRKPLMVSNTISCILLSKESKTAALI